VYFPLYDALQVERLQCKSIGVMCIFIHWAQYFKESLPNSMHGMLVVLENGCDEPYTYQISGANVKALGHGDWHDPQYDSWVRTTTFAHVTLVEDGTPYGIPISNKMCLYAISFCEELSNQDTHAQHLFHGLRFYICHDDLLFV